MLRRILATGLMAVLLGLPLALLVERTLATASADARQTALAQLIGTLDRGEQLWRARA